MYSLQVPLFILANTDTFLPFSSSDSHYLMTPDPQKPMMGKPSFLIPYNPRQKLRSEGFTGAYFIFIRSCPGCRTGRGQDASMGILPYFWIFIPFTVIIMRSVLWIVYAVLFVMVKSRMQISEKLPALLEQIKRGQEHKFQVVQNQTWRYYLSPETKILSRLTNECHLHSAYIGVTGIVSLGVGQELLERSYSFNKNERSLIEFTDARMTKYEIDWLSSKLTKIKDFIFQNSNCSIVMLQNNDENRSFVFSCDGIYEIDTRNMSKEGFMVRKQYFGVFKVLRFEKLLFEMSVNEGVNVYLIDVNIKLTKIAAITKFKNNTLEIADLFYREQILYILDSQKGIFMYRLQSKEFIEFDSLVGSFEQSVKYKFILLNYNNLFVAVDGKAESIVMECSLVGDIMYLVRYYKGYSDIQKLSIFQNKLLIQSRQKIHLLPINKDPRTIRQLNNGYTYTHDSQIRQLHYLQDNKFLIASSSTIQIVAWTVKDSKLECSFSNTGSYSIGVEFPCNVNLKDPFFRVCGVLEQLDIMILSSHRDNYFWLLLIVGGVFIFGVLGLIGWRHDKSMKIKKLLRRIKEFKQKFQPKRKAVQFEQVEHAYSYNDQGKEVTLQLQQKDDIKIGSAEKELQVKEQQVHPYDQFIQSQREQLAQV